MAYFKIVLKGGHMGAGKSYDMVRYYRARDMISAFTSAQSLSRAKKNANATSVYSIEPVPEEEYHRGKLQERKDPYLTYRRRSSRRVCTYQK